MADRFYPPIVKGGIIREDDFTMKLRKCGEAAFVPGVVLLGLATVLMSKASFGLSMVVSPAYVFADWIRIIPTGTMCYIYQGLLVIATSIVMGRFKVSYLITFFSAVCFGLSVDAFGAVFAFIREPELWLRVLLFAVAIPINSLSISLLLHCYFPPQAPELFVRELSRKKGFVMHKTKYVYDLCSCAVSIAMSFILLGELRHVGVGTVVYAFINAPLIGLFGRWLDKIADYEPRWEKLYRLCTK